MPRGRDTPLVRWDRHDHLGTVQEADGQEPERRFGVARLGELQVAVQVDRVDGAVGAVGSRRRVDELVPARVGAIGHVQRHTAGRIDPS
jgi:hypothetical protein